MLDSNMLVHDTFVPGTKIGRQKQNEMNIHGYFVRKKATVIRFVEGNSNILQLFYIIEGVVIHITLGRSYIANKKNNDGIG